MSYINTILLVGEVLEKPEVKTARGSQKQYVVFRMRTGKPVSVNGKTNWVFNEHRVICYKKRFITIADDLIERGTWIKVQGELSYFKGGNTSQIVVAENGGEIGIMAKNVWQAQEDVTDEEVAVIEKHQGKTQGEERRDDIYDQEDAGSSKDQDDDIPF